MRPDREEPGKVCQLVGVRPSSGGLRGASMSGEGGGRVDRPDCALRVTGSLKRLAFSRPDPFLNRLAQT